MKLREHLQRTRATLMAMDKQQTGKICGITGMSATTFWRIQTGKKIPDLWEYEDLLKAIGRVSK